MTKDNKLKENVKSYSRKPTVKAYKRKGWVAPYKRKAHVPAYTRVISHRKRFKLRRRYNKVVKEKGPQKHGVKFLRRMMRNGKAYALAHKKAKANYKGPDWKKSVERMRIRATAKRHQSPYEPEESSF
jgi:hypothetical protein